MAEYKKKNCKYLIAMGCLVQRYKKGNYLKGKILENMFLNFLVRPDIISYEYDKANWSLKLNKLFNSDLSMFLEI